MFRVFFKLCFLKGKIMFNKLRLAQLLSAIVFITASISVSADIFVTNDRGGASVTVYENSASGDALPIREFGVSSGPRGIYVDTVNGEIFVATSNGVIDVFDINANGMVMSLRSITRSGGDFQGIHVDTANNEIFVADRQGNAILVYSRTATGSATPLRSVDLGSEQPRGVSVNANELYVAIRDEVLTFSRTASGSATPLRVITATSELSQLTFDKANSELVVANFGWDTNAIQIWPSAQNGGAAPVRSIIGANTELSSPRGVTVCTNTGEYMAISRNDNAINIYPAGTNGDVAPTRRIIGGNTNLDSPRFIAVTGCDPASVVPVPTMSVWGLGILAGLLGLMGFVRRRKA